MIWVRLRSLKFYAKTCVWPCVFRNGEKMMSEIVGAIMLIITIPIWFSVFIISFGIKIGIALTNIVIKDTLEK